MSEKIITEFSLRLNKARNQLTEVNNQCVGLKKEANVLKKVGYIDPSNWKNRLKRETKHLSRKRLYDWNTSRLGFQM